MYDRSRTSARTLALALLAAVAIGRPAAAADPPPSSDADALALTKAVVLDLHTGRLDRSRVTREFSTLVQGPPFAVLAGPFERLSPPFGVVQRDRVDRNGVTTRTYVVSASGGDEFVTVGIEDASGKIGAFYARPGPPR